MTQSQTKTVLIVDDSTLSRMLIRNLIVERHPDWTILEAASGEAALELVGTTRPDLITLDLNMPGMNGLEAAVALNAQCPSAKLAVLTANVQDSIRQKVQALGIFFVAMVEKPVTRAGVDKILFGLAP
ncbi:response regulator [Chitiniphilus purpureus]|uniref:Response regulator n=1 Tax=Chitiniphilus purpureus TaxID=2981137 RepID=A0ABY6DM21_9NEIS|nr:response regulator [Chitiniphilus sp. CD1]UXY14151.1 response regulator [Chitiniphilus sp. CD1]